MKSFKTFLNENINDIEKSISDFDPNETFIHVNDEGEVVVENLNPDSELSATQNSDDVDEDDFDTFFSDDSESDQEANLGEAEKAGNEKTWGGEMIIDLNFGNETNNAEGQVKEEPQEKETLKEWKFDDNGNAGEEDNAASELLKTLHQRNKDNLNTDTLKYLFTLGQRTMDQVKNDGQKYVIVNKDGGGYELQVKDFKEKDRHPLSDQEIDELIAAKRGENETPPKQPAKFEFDQEGNLLKNGKPIQGRYKKKFIQQLHKAAEKIYGKGKVHYRWQASEDGSDWTDKLEVNTNEWDDSDETNAKRFDTAEYKLVGPEDQERALNIIQTTVKKAREKRKIDIGFDKDTRQFTLNGKPMDKDQLRAFVVGLNGGVGNVKKDKKGNVKDPDEYWKHFKISIKGSKVGDIANFSLPPVQTCNKAAPCISDGCYAVKAYGLYPASRVAQDINLALLKEGKFDQFVREVSAAVRKTFKKTIGAMKEGEKIQYFRFHVSGDVFSSEYLNAICDIADANPNVGFWTYTKQYDLLLKNMDRVLKTKNLSVLVSCWGEFRPKAFGEKYKVLEENFPLAYLDDGSEEMKNYIDTKDGQGEPFVCPCTDYSEAEVHCNKCLKCYKVSEIMNTNLVFKKH